MRRGATSGAGSRAGLALVLTAGLAACSGGLAPEGRDPGGQQFAGLDGLVAERMPRPAAAPEGPVRIVEAAAPQPRLRAALPRRGTSADLVAVGQNGDVVTWVSPDEVSLALLEPGVLIATRGLGQDLHIAEAGGSAAALAGGSPGAAARRHLRLGGDQRLAESRHDCTLVAAGPEALRLDDRTVRTLRFEERCSGGVAGSFVNRYWRDATRPVIWQSEQWIGPEVGHVRLQRLGG